MAKNLEIKAAIPTPLDKRGFNPRADLPYGLTTNQIRSAMNEFLKFLGFVNQQMVGKGLPRLETMLMPANFSGLVGEFMGSSIPKFSKGLVKNRYHNGHPDLIPANCYKNDSVQHCNKGIEIKASRYLKGWQGHNPENTWLMVFVFDSNRPPDLSQGINPKPFRFISVVGALLTKKDWLFAGRSKTSRRTITASVIDSGYQKMIKNWIYKAPSISKG